MPIQFPNAPSLGSKYSYGGANFIFDGVKWKRQIGNSVSSNSSVEIVQSLPAAIDSVGKMLILESDGKLYTSDTSTYYSFKPDMVLDSNEEMQYRDNTSVLIKAHRYGISDASLKNNYLSLINSVKHTETNALFNSHCIELTRSLNGYITISNLSGSLDLGANDFTIETFFKLKSNPSGTGYPNSYWILGWGENQSPTGMDFSVYDTGIQFSPNNFNSNIYRCPYTFNLNQWYHVCVEKNLGVTNIYIDGISIFTTSDTYTVYPATGGKIAIGAAEPVGAIYGNFDGFIQELRIVKGLAVHKGNFQMQTVPLGVL